MSVRHVPSDVGSANAKLVYLSLATGGPASLDDLQDALDLSQLTLLTVLRSLREAGHVASENGAYATRPA